MGYRRVVLLLVCIAVPACGGGGGGGGSPVVFVGVGTPATPSVKNGAVPPALAGNVELGIANFDLAWVTATGNIPFGYRSQYLSGGVNRGIGWTTWNSPPGQFASLYMTASDGKGMIPVFDYYQLRESSPNPGSENPHPKLQNPSTMLAYYEEFKLLMQKCAAFNKAVVVHVEPDFWGFCQQQSGTAPENIAVCVANTGFPEAAAFDDNLCGFAQVLVKLRNDYAPKVLIALHASHWGEGHDLIQNNRDPVAHANATGAFFNNLGAAFDLMFHDPSDRDAGFKQAIYNDGGAGWWDAADFTRYKDYLAQMKVVTGRRNILWQVPLGNTKSATCNNTWGHYQDNRVEYWLDDTPHANVTAFAAAGVIAILWGAPENGTTHYDDAVGDGPGAPAVSDDDGGYFRTRAAAYYSTSGGNPGPIPLP